MVAPPTPHHLYQHSVLERGLKTLAEVRDGGGSGDLIKRWFPVPEEEIQYCRHRFLIGQFPSSRS